MKSKILDKADRAKVLALFLIFLFAIFLRVFLLFSGKSLWLDEAALALNILDKGYVELFGPLLYAQSAPPLFLVFAKFWVSAFGAIEAVLRLLSFLFSCASIFAFYFLADFLFKNKKWLVCLSVFIFSLGFQFLYNSIEFKPYTSDVFFTILSILIYFKYLDKEISAKCEFCFAILLALFPLFSFGSIFPLCTILIFSLFKKRKILPFVLLAALILEYLFIFSKVNPIVQQYWVPYFINHSLSKTVFIFVKNFKYYFYPANLLLFGFALFATGCVCIFKYNKKIFFFFALMIFGAFLASFLNIYPLYDRLSLFLYPIFLVFILSPLYYLVPAKGRFAFIKTALVYFFVAGFLFDILFYNFFDIRRYKREEIKPLLLALQKDINPGDKIFVFKGAHATYWYYSKTVFKNTLGKFSNDTYVCPHNMKTKDCFDKIKPFCSTIKTTFAGSAGKNNSRNDIWAQNSCYIILSSETYARDNAEYLGKYMQNLDGKIILEDVNSILYKVD